VVHSEQSLCRDALRTAPPKSDLTPERVRLQNRCNYNDSGTFIYMNLYSVDECSEQSHGFLSEKLHLIFYVFVSCIVIQLCSV